MSCTARLLFDPPLRLFLPARDRGGRVHVRLDGSSLGHLVQSAGVPLTEVGRMQRVRTEDPGVVEPGYRPRAADDIRVPAVPRPQPMPGRQPRFVLDVHLGALARRMRLFGIDTSYTTDATDGALVEQALAEDRMLLTKDRGILRRRVLRRHAAYVRGDRADVQATDVIDRFALAVAPLTRCPRCNGSLAAVRKQDVQDDLLPGTARTYAEFARCSDCAQVYWRGAHAAAIERMLGAPRGR